MSAGGAGTEGAGLSEAEVENHVCCLKRHLCRDDHFHQRDVERIVAERVAEAERRVADRNLATFKHGHEGAHSSTTFDGGIATTHFHLKINPEDA